MKKETMITNKTGKGIDWRRMIASLLVAAEVMMVVVLVALAVEQEAEATSQKLIVKLSHYQQTVVNRL